MSTEFATATVNYPTAKALDTSVADAIVGSAINAIIDSAQSNFDCNGTCENWDGLDDCDGACEYNDIRANKVEIAEPTTYENAATQSPDGKEAALVVPLTDNENSYYVVVPYHV